MKTHLMTLLIGGAAIAATTSSEALTTNRWNLSTGGKWETAVDWSTGNGPSLNDGLDLISPIGSLGIVVTMDATTAENFFGTMTISNLTVSGIGGILSRNATLLLSNTDSIAQFTVINNATISAFGHLFVTNSIINGGSANFYLNSDAQFYGSTFQSRDCFVGATGGGALIISNSAFGAVIMDIGSTSGNGTFTFAGGTAQVISNCSVGVVGGVGTVWVLDGLWIGGSDSIDLGDNGSGRMTVSNGTVQAHNLNVGVGGSSQGTLTLAGGTIMLNDNVNVGNGSGATGTVWITGGQLDTTNITAANSSTISVSGGVGRMTLSNGVWNARQINVGPQGSVTVAGGTVACTLLNLSGNSNGNVVAQMSSGSLAGGVTVSSNATMNVSGGNWTGGATVEGLGTLTLSGGASTVTLAVNTGLNPNATGTVWLTGGQLTTTANVTYLGKGSFGRMIVSNGTWDAGEVDVGSGGDPDSEQGLESDLVIAGGTHTISGALKLGVQELVPGDLWMSGGQLTVPTARTYLGSNGIGQVTISNGVFQASDVFIGLGANGSGTLTTAGGTMTCNNLSIGGGIDNMIFVYAGAWVNGGLLSVASRTVISSNSLGQLTVSNGVWRAGSVAVAPFVLPGSDGTLTIAGGVSHVYSNLIVGYVGCTPLAQLIISGGTLYVTNTAHNALLEVLGGTLTMSGGSLVADRIVVTNSCAHILVTGGSVSYGTVVLDPNGDADGDGLPNGWELAHGLNPFSNTGNDGASGDPDGDGYTNLQEYEAGSDPRNPLSTPVHPTAPPFQITSMVRTGNNIMLKWNTAGGLTNQMQVTSGISGGSYSTNGFANLGPQMIIGGTAVTTTNYTDLGGATNKPARYYRIKLVP